MKKLIVAIVLPLFLTGCPWDSKDSNEPISTPVELGEKPTIIVPPTTDTIPNGVDAGGTETFPESDSGISDEINDINQTPSGDLGSGGITPPNTGPSETPQAPDSKDWRTDMLTLVNAQRAQGTTCGGQFYPAQAPLSQQTLLNDAAQLHSEDMRDQNYFSHTSLDGRSAGTRISNAGYDWNSYAENIAAGQDTVEEVVQGWIDSPGHCANIMRSSVTEVGFGLATGGGQYGQYWTQNFGRR